MQLPMFRWGGGVLKQLCKNRILGQRCKRILPTLWLLAVVKIHTLAPPPKD